MEKFIEGPEISKGDKVIIIEGVVTAGTSVLKAVEAVRKVGGNVSEVKVCSFIRHKSSFGKAHQQFTAHHNPLSGTLARPKFDFS